MQLLLAIVVFDFAGKFNAVDHLMLQLDTFCPCIGYRGDQSIITDGEISGHLHAFGMGIDELMAADTSVLLNARMFDRFPAFIIGLEKEKDWRVLYLTRSSSFRRAVWHEALVCSQGFHYSG